MSTVAQPQQAPPQGQAAASGQAPAPTTAARSAQDREKVLLFLRNAGLFRAYSGMLTDMADQDGFEPRTRRLAETIGDSLPLSAVPGAQNYEQMYREFREWCRNSLLEFQLPYLMLSFPIMLHVYVVMACDIEAGRDATNFLRRYVMEFDTLRGEEVRQLLQMRPEKSAMMNQPALLHLLNNRLFTVTISALAHSTLIVHLSSKRNFLMLEILARRVQFNIVESTNEANASTLAAELSYADLKEVAAVNQLPLRWGLAPEIFPADQTQKIERSRRALGAAPVSINGRYDYELTESGAHQPVNASLLYSDEKDKEKEKEKGDKMLDKEQGKDVVGSMKTNPMPSHLGGHSQHPNAAALPPSIVDPTAQLLETLQTKAPSVQTSTVGSFGLPPVDRSSVLFQKLQQRTFTHVGHRVEVRAHQPPRGLRFHADNSVDATCMQASPGGGHYIATAYQEGEIRLTCLHNSVAAIRNQETKLWDPERMREQALRTGTTDQILMSHGEVLRDTAHETMAANAANGTGAIAQSLAFSALQHMIPSLDALSTPLDPSRWVKPISLIGHAGAVYGMEFSSDDRMLLSCGQDGTARLWSVDAQCPLTVIRNASQGATLCCTFSANDTYFALGSAEGLCKLYVPERSDALRVFLANNEANGACHSVKMHPNSSMLLTSTADRVVRVFDIRTAKPVRTLFGLPSAALQTAFSPGGRLVAAGATDGTVNLWDLPSGRLVHSVQAHKGAVSSMDFAKGSQMLATSGLDGVVRLWDTFLAAVGRCEAQESQHAQKVSAVQNYPLVAAHNAFPHLKLQSLAPLRSLPVQGVRFLTCRFSHTNMLMTGSIAAE